MALDYTPAAQGVYGEANGAAAPQRIISPKIGLQTIAPKALIMGKLF